MCSVNMSIVFNFLVLCVQAGKTELLRRLQRLLNIWTDLLKQFLRSEDDQVRLLLECVDLQAKMRLSLCGTRTHIVEIGYSPVLQTSA